MAFVSPILSEIVFIMLPEQIVGFLLVALLFIAIPGPNVLVIVATSIVSGRTRGLQTVIGTSLAMLLQLLIAALATNSVLQFLGAGLLWLKWLGVGYLLYLAGKSLYRCWHPVVADISASGSLQRGFWVALTNPKTILFFSAFLPQFVSSADHYLFQIGVLSFCFWILAVFCDSAYALLASRLTWLVDANKVRTSRLQNGLSGTLFLTASGILAVSHRT